MQTGGGAELTSRDLLKLGELVRSNGVVGDNLILPQSWIDDMLRVHVKANDEQDYGYQWWRRDFACGGRSISGWYMSGNGGNKVVIFADVDLTVVVTATLYGTDGMHQQSTDIIEDFVLSGLPECRRD